MSATDNSYRLSKGRHAWYCSTRGKRNNVFNHQTNMEMESNTKETSLTSTFCWLLCRCVFKMFNHDVCDLLKSVQAGNLEEVKRYHSNGIDMMQADYDKRTALHIAAADGQERICRYLLDQCNVDPFLKDRWGQTAYDEAVRFGHSNVLLILRQYEHDNPTNEVTQPYLPTKTHTIPSAVTGSRRRFWHSSSKRANDMMSFACLMLAKTYKGDYEAIIKSFKKLGMDMFMTDNDGRTMLHIASAEGYTQIVQFLVKQCGMDPLAEDRWKHTALSDAKHFQHKDIVSFLEENLSPQDISNVNNNAVAGTSIPVKRSQLEQVQNNSPAKEDKCVINNENKPTCLSCSNSKRDISMSMLSRKLSREEMLEMSGYLGKNWELLGINIGIKQSDIDHIKQENKNSTSQQIYKMLDRWSKTCENATCHHLIQAIDACPFVTCDLSSEALRKLFTEYKCNNNAAANMYIPVNNGRLEEAPNDTDTTEHDGVNEKGNERERVPKYQTNSKTEMLTDMFRGLTSLECLQIARRIGKNWQFIGIYLEIDQSVIERSILNNPNNTIKQIYEMLYHWSKSCKTATRDHLIKALIDSPDVTCDLNREELHKVLTKYKDNGISCIANQC